MLVAVLLTAMSVPEVVNGQDKPQTPSINLPDFQLATTPNTLDQPGTMFAIDREGVRHELGRLDASHDVRLKQSPLTRPLTIKAKLTVADLELLLRGEGQSRPPGQGVEPGRRVEVELLLGEATKIELSDNLDKVLSSSSVIAKWKDEHKYFLIVEAVAASTISYKFKKKDLQALGGWLSSLAAGNADITLDQSGKFQVVQKFKTPQTVALRLNRLSPETSTLTGVPTGTVRDGLDGASVAWSTVLAPLPWPPPSWSARLELPPSLLTKNGSTLGGAFDVVINAFNSANISDRWVYGIGHDGFAVIGRQEAIDGEGNPLPGAKRWRSGPCVMAHISFSELARCVSGGATENQRITMVLVTSRLLESQSATPTDSLRQDSGRTSLPQQMRATPLPQNVTGQALIYHFVQLNQNPAQLVPREKETIRAVDHLSRAGFWRREALTP